jgi:hypothetical protein
MTNHTTKPASETNTSDWVNFDFHGLVRMRVARSARSLPNLVDMMRPFLVDEISGYEITVEDAPLPMTDPSRFEDHLRYTDTAVTMLGPDVQVARTDGGFRVSGTRELLTTVLPVLDWMMIQKGAGMIHAATFAYKGHGVFMPAWGGVGKTSTIAKLSKYDDVAFMGDDWGFVTDSGMMLGYAKPMFMKPHHKPIFPHMFEGGRKPLVPSSMTKYVHSISTRFHPMVTKYPQLAAFTRKWSPEHKMVTPAEALPSTEIATSAPLAVSVFVERHDGAESEFVPVSEEWLVSRMVGNFHAELSGPSRNVITALGATGLMPLERLFDGKARVFSKGVTGKPAFLLRVPAVWSADRASDDMVIHLFEALTASGVAV